MTATRLAAKDDLPALVALFEEREGARFSADSVAHRLAGLDPARGRTLVSTVDGRVAAMSTLIFRDFGTPRKPHRVGYWTDLYVAESARNASLYLPLARATLAQAEADGASCVMTANRRREVWAGHLKLGFRIATAIPTRARPIGALTTAARIAAGPSLAALVAPLDAAAFDLVSRATRRPRASLPVERRAIDRATAAELLTLIDRDRGRSLGTLYGVDSLLARYATPLDGRAYEALILREGEVAVGGAVIRTARRSRFEITVVLDLLDGGDRDRFHALVAAIEARARATRTDLVLVLDGVADQSVRWDEAGYRTTPEWYVLLVAPAERAADRSLGDGSSWRFPFAEHDAF